MESTDIEVCVHGDTAVVTGITTSKGQFMGEGFATRERSTDVLARLNGRLVMCLLATHSSRVGLTDRAAANRETERGVPPARTAPGG